jgi:hypothetical protein
MNRFNPTKARFSPERAFPFMNAPVLVALIAATIACIGMALVSGHVIELYKKIEVLEKDLIDLATRLRLAQASLIEMCEATTSTRSLLVSKSLATKEELIASDGLVHDWMKQR